VKDTRHSLVADAVGGPAQQGPVVELRHGSVGHDTGGAGPSDVRRSHVQTLRGVVERPPEMNVWGIRIYFTRYICLLLLGNSVYPRLVRLARRRVWTQR
jgi:hypothetical protein